MDFEKESLTDLEARLRTILPELYQDRYEEVQPVSMGSAALKYGPDGKVAWGEMWDTFCDLAMAGGPPHKGSLLLPGTAEDIAQNSVRYAEVTEEIRRGIALVADLTTEPSAFPGWLRIECDDALMAQWLVRAITMENISCHCEDDSIYLPASPSFRIDKEIKNVITVVAKTCHYWVDHMWIAQQRQIANLFAAMSVESPLLAPPFPVAASTPSMNPDEVLNATGLEVTSQANGWLGLKCESVSTAVWIMRALVASNVLARREKTTLFVPVNENADPARERMLQAVAHVCKLARTAAAAHDSRMGAGATIVSTNPVATS